ncbi:MAG: peptidylprolyl isomerase [Chloroflexi bacterium]|nr:peptidylprolyl isomerase [Chloroflexota bacterium]
MGKQTRSAEPKELNRKQLSRQSKDARTRRRLIYGTLAVVGLALLVLGYGLLDQYVLQPRRPAAIVNGTEISRKAYETRLAYRQWDYDNYLQQLEQQRTIYASSEDQSFMVDLIDQQISSLQSEILTLSSTTLTELVDEEIYKQEAAKRGITVADEDVQYTLETQFGYYSVTPTPYPTIASTATSISVTPTAQITSTMQAVSPTVTATATVTVTETPYPTSTPMTKEQFESRLSTWLNSAQQASGFTEADLQTIIRNALLRQKVQQAIADEVPTVAEQVHARHILFATREEAEAALVRIKAGEDFATLATELSTDTGSKLDGGDLGWFTKGTMLTEFEDAAFSLPVGQVSDVVETSAGFHLILVLDHQAERPLDADALQQAQDTAVSKWLEAQRASPDIKILLSS